MNITTKRVIGVLIGLVIVLVLLTYFTSAEREAKVAVESITAGPKTITTMLAKPEDVPLRVSEIGIIRAIRQITLVAESSGKVMEVRANVGDRVKKGDVIYVLEDELPRLSFEESQAGLIIAESAHEKAGKDLDRAEALYETSDISLNELESSRLAFKNAEGNLLRAHALLDMAERKYRDTRIASPLTGIVTTRACDRAEMVNPGMPVAVVVDAESVKVILGISDTEVTMVHEGQECAISVDAYADRTFDGWVRSVSIKADEDSGTFPVEVVAPNTGDLALKSGMVATVSITTGMLDNVILLPRDAIERRRGSEVTFVIRDGKAIEREVTSSGSVGDMSVVTEGISPGERVVVVGVENLVDGDPVREGI